MQKLSDMLKIEIVQAQTNYQTLLAKSIDEVDGEHTYSEALKWKGLRKGLERALTIVNDLGREEAEKAKHKDWDRYLFNNAHWIYVEGTGGSCEALRVDFEDGSMCYATNDGNAPLDAESFSVSFYRTDSSEDYEEGATVEIEEDCSFHMRMRAFEHAIGLWCENRNTVIKADYKRRKEYQNAHPL